MPPKKNEHHKALKQEERTRRARGRKRAAEHDWQGVDVFRGLKSCRECARRTRVHLQLEALLWDSPTAPALVSEFSRSSVAVRTHQRHTLFCDSNSPSMSNPRDVPRAAINEVSCIFFIFQLVFIFWLWFHATEMNARTQTHSPAASKY